MPDNHTLEEYLRDAVTPIVRENILNAALELTTSN
jgi:hypothetical protein